MHNRLRRPSLMTNRTRPSRQQILDRFQHEAHRLGARGGCVTAARLQEFWFQVAA